MICRLMIVRAALSAILISAALSNMLAPTASAHSTPIEPGAGAWKTWVITSSTQIQTLAPPGTKTTKEEVVELLSMQTQRGKSALETVRYWDSGSLLRWNEISLQGVRSSSSVVTERSWPLKRGDYDAMIAAWRASIITSEETR